MLLTLYKSALSPKETKALIKLKIKSKEFAPPKQKLEDLAPTLDDRAFCYMALKKVSRSFSFVIHQLPEKLRDPVCIFYLVLRALDTIEDDMSIPLDEKLVMLETFHEKTRNVEFSLQHVGDQEDYRVLLAYYPKVLRVFNGLDEASKKAIVDITARMGKGMGAFAEKEIDTLDDFNLYCHYVAGLVGIGLSGIFIASKLEKLAINKLDDVSNEMGLFLQKTNIIRDYHEDLYADRTFWPKEIWGQYADNLEDLAKNPERKNSLACLNHMVTDALQHIPACLYYLKNVQNEQIFRFTAIPQIMAIATLAKLYNNSKVLKGEVKIRKGIAARLMIYPFSLDDMSSFYSKHLKKIKKKCTSKTPYSKETLKQLIEINSAI